MRKCLLVALLCRVAASRAQLGCRPVASGVFSAVDTASNATGVINIDGSLYAGLTSICMLTVGSKGAHTSLSDLLSDGDPGYTSLAIFGAPIFHDFIKGGQTISFSLPIIMTGEGLSRVA